MTPLEKIRYLNICLPHDVLAAEKAGYLTIADKLIDKKLENPTLLQGLRNRLELEKVRIKKLPAYYPYTLKEGLAIMQKEIPDYTMTELLKQVHEDQADWIYIDGNVHLQNRFYASLKKTQDDLAARAHTPNMPNRLLDQNMADMKKNGSAKWHIHLKTALQLKSGSYEEGKRILVHLPIPAACDNMKNIQILSHSDHAKIDQADSCCRTISFEEVMTSNHPFEVEYAYDSCVTYHHVTNGNPYQGSMYLQQMQPHIVFTPMIRDVCQQLSGEEKDPAVLARRFYDYITQNVRYSYMPAYFLLDDIPDYCLSSLKGDCGVQALTFITLCRCAGIPAVWQSGKFVQPGSTGNHDWARFYIEPYGWLYADCSFGGSAYRSHNEERRQFYFGNLDPFRMAANNAFQQEFNPAKKYLRKDPFDNQSGEVEYEDKGLDASDFTCSTQVIEMHQVI